MPICLICYYYTMIVIIMARLTSIKLIKYVYKMLDKEISCEKIKNATIKICFKNLIQVIKIVGNHNTLRSSRHVFQNKR